MKWHDKVEVPLAARLTRLSEPSSGRVVDHPELAADDDLVNRKPGRAPFVAGVCLAFDLILGAWLALRLITRSFNLSELERADRVRRY
jgi:hypothetical protein